MEQTNLFASAKVVEDIDLDALEELVDDENIQSSLPPEVVKEEEQEESLEEIEALIYKEEEKKEKNRTEKQEEEEEEYEEESSSPAKNVFAPLLEKYGLDFELEEGEDLDEIDFAASVIATMAEELKELKAQKRTVEIDNPLVKKFQDFVEKGNIQEFYEVFKKSADTKLSQLEDLKRYSEEELIYAEYIEQGYSEKEAEEIINELAEKDAIGIEYKKIFKKYERLIEKGAVEEAKDFLDSKLSEINKEEEQEAVVLEEAKKELAITLSKIGSVDNFKISESDKEQIFSFITEADQDGMTGFDKWLQSNENLIFAALMAQKAKDIFEFQKTYYKNKGKAAVFDSLSGKPIPTKSKSKEVSRTYQQMINEINKI